MPLKKALKRDTSFLGARPRRKSKGFWFSEGSAPSRDRRVVRSRAFCPSRGHFRVPRASLDGLWKREIVRGLVKWGNPIKYMRASSR